MSRNDDDGDLSFSYMYTDFELPSCNICGSDEISKPSVHINDLNVIIPRLSDIKALELTNSKLKMTIQNQVDNDANSTVLNLNLVKLRCDILSLTDRNRKS